LSVWLVSVVFLVESGVVFCANTKVTANPIIVVKINRFINLHSN